jgi:hypothetical protein
MEMVTEIIQTGSALENNTNAKSSSSWLSLMLQAVNSDGWNPRQVAQLAGHDDMVQILDAAGGGDGKAGMEDEFVYDEYWLCPDAVGSAHGVNDEEHDNDANDNPQHHVDVADILTVELQGGYWENGELLFSPEEEHQEEEEFGDQDDEDSNSEGYAGNDYPEDNDNGDQVWLAEEKDGDDDDDDSDQEDGMTSFRNAPVDYNGTILHRVPPPWATTYAYDDADDEYDAGYGDHQVEAQRQFSYDPKWDREEDDDGW